MVRECGVLERATSGGYVLARVMGLGLLGLAAAASAQKLAFPSAEGYGKYTVGGRGGKVYEVTTLEDSGPGSLRAAVEASGPRTVVFRVSGTIALNSNLKISNPYITIAGQTAPGDGICLRRHSIYIDADQVIIRYLRERYGDEVKVDADAVSMRFHKNILLDHISASWGDDETMSVYHGDSVTVQWSIIAETLNRGGVHGFAGIWGGNYSTYHHNLIANCVSRNIRWASGSGNTDYRNNVIYNWGYNSSYGGEQQQVNDPIFSFTNINMVANYYKPGPATEAKVAHRIVNPTYRDVKTDYGKFYVADNHVVGNATVTADNWNGGVDPAGGSGDLSLVKLAKPWAAMPIAQQTAVDAYTSVLAKAGCSFPKRDAVDTRIIDETRSGKATFGTGIIETQATVGGWPALASAAAPADGDHDGMPDAWEASKGLNPANAEDRNGYTIDKNYTNLEMYLNGLTSEVATGIVSDEPLTGGWVVARVPGSAGRVAFRAPAGAQLWISDLEGRIRDRISLEAGSGTVDVDLRRRGMVLLSIVHEGTVLATSRVASGF